LSINTTQATIRLTYAAPDSTLPDYVYELDGVGNRIWVTETLM
jgi:hypothetical protein